MSSEFFAEPILNSPYDYPGRHWELDNSGQPTTKIVEARRRAEFLTPIPKPESQGKKKARQQELNLQGEASLNSQCGQYAQCRHMPSSAVKA